MTTAESYRKLDECREALGYSFVGPPEVIDRVLTGLISGLHVLVEDVPGVGKTTLARTLARVAGLEFGRIQLSPDVLPGDIVGMHIYDPQAREFVFRPGAVEHQCVLADELNRASERTQSALLEAMQEEQVTVDGVTRALPQPFFLIATQNPARFAGTFRLPEGQVDRFGLCCSIGYPSEERELEVLERVAERRRPETAPVVLNAEALTQMRELCAGVRVESAVRRYIVKLAGATRRSRHLESGVSPRAAGHLLRAAQAAAIRDGRDYVMPEDARNLVPAVFGHRLTLSAEARMSDRSLEHVLEGMVDRVVMPTGMEEEVDARDE